MLFYTRSSPLFFTNNWVDANAFMTMGKGIVHGLVPYKDLFEQKGPVLYFLHALAYIIYSNSFFGIYILESIAMAINMIIFYKIAKLFVNNHFAYLLAFILPALVLYSAYFMLGDSAEEFAFPCVLFLIYTVLLKIEYREFAFPKRTLFLQGILLGFVFFIKYTLIGAWIGFFLFYGFYLLWKKQFVKLLQALISSLAGFLAMALPVFVYFFINHGLNDLYEVYFKFNLTMYSEQSSILQKIVNVFVFLLLHLSYTQYIFVFLSLIGAFFIFITKRGKYNSITVSVLFLVMFLSTAFFQYVGGRYNFYYYFLIVIPFTSIGLISFAWLFEKVIVLRKNILIIYLTAFVLAIIFPFFHNKNILYSRFFPANSDQIVKSPMNTNQNTTMSAQREFAEIIKKVPNATLLNYGYLDYGFYLAADILPNVRFFEKQNIDNKLYPENQLKQDEYIREKKVDFVVLTERYYSNILEENYHLVAVHLQTREGIVEKYLLYQKK